jgi:foldase protein PrsA
MAVLADRSLACAASFLIAIFALSACGGGASRHSVQRSGSVAALSADPTAEPNAVVVRVGGHAITKAMFAHAFAGLVKSEGPNAVAPVPPDFAACIKHVEAASAQSPPTGSKPSVAQLKGDCQQQYQKFEKEALDSLILEQWVIGGAAEEGVYVSDQELEQQLKKAEAGQSQAQAARELATSGRTLADFARETKVQLLGEGIRHVLAKRTGHVTTAQVVNYYNENKRLFSVPKRRDLEIVRAGTEAEARKIKNEIASGKTFASVAKNLPLAHRPVFSREGVVLNYEPGLYREPPLDHAIFTAKPNVLSGPVGISLGYYVFEVKRTYPPHQKTLAQAQAAIRQQLPDKAYKQALVAFVREWRKRWRARTDCRAGYVVAKCRQFKASSAASLEEEDPYSFK